MIKLIDVIKKFDNPELQDIAIEQRVYIPNGGGDLYAGKCHYDRDSGELCSDDLEYDYGLNQDVVNYDMYTDIMSGKQYLTVWVDSEYWD